MTLPHDRDRWGYEDPRNDMLDDYEENLMNCGMMRDWETGELVGCTKAGSEYCELDCPINWEEQE